MKKTFTLIELVVIIAVFALLVSLPIPAISAARGRSADTVCADNLKNLGVAFSQYGNNNKGFMPRINDLRGDKKSWKARLVVGGYVPSPGKGKTGIFLCPKAVAVPAYEIIENGQHGYGMWKINDYTDSWLFTNEVQCHTKNNKIWYPTKDNDPANGKRFSPSDFTFVFDSFHPAYSRTVYNVPRNAFGSIGAERIDLLHGKRANSLMGDGHVKSMTADDLKVIGWPDKAFHNN